MKFYNIFLIIDIYRKYKDSKKRRILIEKNVIYKMNHINGFAYLIILDSYFRSTYLYILGSWISFLLS